MKKYIATIIVLAVVLLVAVPLIWFFVDSINLLSTIGIIQSGVVPSNWTDIFLGYFGSSISAILGYTAVIVTISQQEKARREDNAKEVLPLLSAEPYHEAIPESVIITNGDYEAANLNATMGGILKLRNVGMREMYNLKVVSMRSDKFDDVVTNIEITPILYTDGDAYLCIYPTMEGKLDDNKVQIHGQTFEARGKLDVSIDVTFSYQDCYENMYTQDFRLACTSRLNLFEHHDGNIVVYTGATINRCNIVGAPKPQ